MVAVFIIFIALLIILAVLLGFFKIAFVRFKEENINDFSGNITRSLLPHKEQIMNSIKYIDSLKNDSCYIKSFDGLNLFARYFRAENPKGTIILFHGYRSFAKRDFSCAIKMYLEMGLNILLVDQRSHGQSEGKLITFGIKERFDVLYWVDFIIKKNGKDEKIFLGGMSMGATSVLLCANMGLPKNVKGIIADSGFDSPIEIIKRVAKRTYGINAKFVIPIFNLFCLLFGKFSLYDISVEDAVKNSSVPIFFIHGLADNFVPVQMCKKSYASANCEKEILLVENAGHGLGYFFNKEGIENGITKFINSNLCL